jgi:hypothetical protein
MDTFKVVYNNCFGGFGLSLKALEEYNCLTKNTFKYSECIDRENTTLIKLVEDYKKTGINVNDNYSKLKIKEFPVKYKKYLKWSEYDGNENVTIDYDRYIIENVKHILSTEINDPEKIDLISKLYNEVDLK